ncbi:hypothetical protein ABFS82_14G090500 [Erythranthe guttata]
MKPIFLICILVLLTLFVFFPPISSANTIADCPLDLDYVLTIPWNTSDCIEYNHNPTNNSGGPTAATSSCCQTLLSLYGVSLSQRLKNTSLFQLPDLPSSISCLENFQQELTSLSLPATLTSLCFDPLQFVISSNTCAAIQSTANWSAKLGNSTAVDASCKSDLTDPTSCDACVAAGFRVQADLIAIDGNTSHSVNCFYFTVLYAAGIVNQYGPQSTGAVSCIFGLPIISGEKGSSNNRHSAILFGLIAAATILAALSLFGFLALYLRRNRKNHAEGEDQVGPTRPRRRPTTISVSYRIEELERATDNFDPKNLIDRVGFSTVYKGALSDGTIVAVKKVTESDIQENEVEVIDTLKHRNLVPIRGCCISEKNEKYLVYDYMPKGNLKDRLFSFGDSPLTWRQRKSIIADVAKGLGYLHYGVKPAVFHGDIKSTNVLLDNDMKARIADFGLAKQSREGESNFEKSDVYRFGVVVLEVMCGRKVPELLECSIADWAWSFVKEGEVEKVLEDSLLKEGDSSRKVMERFVRVGILCARVMAADSRPTIVEALKMLDGDILVPSIPDH